MHTWYTRFLLYLYVIVCINIYISRRAVKTHTLEGLVCVLSLRERHDFSQSIHPSFDTMYYLWRFSLVLLALRARPALADPLPFSLNQEQQLLSQQSLAARPSALDLESLLKAIQYKNAHSNYIWIPIKYTTVLMMLLVTKSKSVGDLLSNFTEVDRTNAVKCFIQM